MQRSTSKAITIYPLGISSKDGHNMSGFTKVIAVCLKLDSNTYLKKKQSNHEKDLRNVTSLIALKRYKAGGFEKDR